MMGRVLADGGKLYVDTLEFKPPGMFVIWQVIHELVGTSPRVVLWISILVATLTMLGVYWAGSAKPWGRLGGIWAMCFWTLISGDMMLQANQPNNEVFMNLFMIWGLALWVRADSEQAGWRHALAGLLLGLVTLIKPVLFTAVFMVLAWVLAEGLNPAALKRRAWAIRWALLSLVAPWALMVLYFVCQGRGGDLYNSVVRYATFYAGTKAGGQAEGDTANIGMNILRGLGFELMPAWMVFLGPLIMLTALGIWGGLHGRQRSQALTIVGCLFGTFLAVSIPGTFFPHYYQLYLPILAVGAGWGITTVANSFRQWALAQWIGLVTVLLLLWHVVPDLRFDGRTWSRMKYQAGFYIEAERCGRAVHQMLTADESFYVWGIDPGVYYYSDRRPASGVFWADRLLVGPLKDQATRKVMADLEKTKPPLILSEDLWYLKPPPDHPFFQLLREHYGRLPGTKFSKFFSVFIRRDSALAQRLLNNPQPFVLTLVDVDPVFLKESYDELVQQGRPQEAMAYLQKAVEIDPDNPKTHINLGDALAAQGKLNEAIPHFEQALTLATAQGDAMLAESIRTRLNSYRK